MDSKRQSNTWLVTGGAGFLGLHLCRYLLKQNQRVISYDRAEIPESEKLENLVEITADILDKETLKKSLQGVDCVVHCAGELALAKPEQINAVNAEGTKGVIECCATSGVRRFIFVGTTAVYGMPKFHPIYEDAPQDPMGHYGIAKAKAEQYIRQTKGIEWIIIRPKSFIGTGRLGIFQLLFDWIESGRKIPVFGSGNNVFQLLSVTDLCEAIYLAMLRATPNQIYNIGAKKFSTVNEDVGALLKYANTGSRLLHVPAGPLKFVLRILEFLHLSPVYRWVYDTADQDSFVSVEKSEKDFGFIPKFSNQDTLIETYQWYLDEGKILAQNYGTGHRVAWKQGILSVIKYFF